MNKQQMHFNRFMERLTKLSDEEIVESFNQQVGCAATVSARISLLGAILQQFRRRGFDYSYIGGEHRLSFSCKLKLDGKKVKIIPH